MERGATISDLVSEVLARESGSAEAGSSVVVVPTPTDPAGIRTIARGSRKSSSRLYYMYPFGKGPGQHIIRCLKNKKCENEMKRHGRSESVLVVDRDLRQAF